MGRDVSGLRQAERYLIVFVASSVARLPSSWLLTLVLASLIVGPLPDLPLFDHSTIEIDRS